MITAEEQILAKALAAYKARITSATATVDANHGVPSVTVTISGEDAEKVLGFDFKNLVGNGVSSITFDENGNVITTLADGSEASFNGFKQAMDHLKKVCGIVTFTDENDTGDIVIDTIPYPV